MNEQKRTAASLLGNGAGVSESSDQHNRVEIAVDLARRNFGFKFYLQRVGPVRLSSVSQHISGRPANLISPRAGREALRFSLIQSFCDPYNTALSRPAGSIST